MLQGIASLNPDDIAAVCHQGMADVLATLTYNNTVVRINRFTYPHRQSHLQHETKVVAC